MIVQGFDSRYWDGKMPPGYLPGDPGGFKFFGGKLTESDYFVNHLAPIQFEAAGKLGLPRLGWMFHRCRADYKGAVRIYRTFFKALDVDGPPVLDAEDTSVTPSAFNALQVWLTVQEIEQVFGTECLIYTARWCWDRMVKPFLGKGHLIYERPLWEADPPPPTPSPGFFKNPVITQVKLDWSAPGFNAKIDVDECDDAWLAKYVRLNRQPLPIDGQLREFDDFAGPGF